MSVLEGVLTANPLLDEIRRLHDEGQTGILTLVNSRDERVDVFFHEGMVDAASSNLSAHRLGDYLVRDGHLPVPDLNAAQSEARHLKISFGEAVVRKRLVEQAEVGAAARSQAIELLDHVLKNGFSVVSFTSSLRSYYAPARVSYTHMLLELSRSNPEPFEPGSRMRVALSDGVDLSVFPWYPQELCLLGELKSPNTFEGLLKATGIEAGSLKRILGVLQRLKVIETLDTAEPMNLEVMKKPEFEFEHLIPLVTNAMLNEKLEVARNGSSFAAEQFKNLKVQLSQADAQAPLKVFTVSSPEPQDGKSLISANLAFSFAMDPGRRVIIVDCDLRNPAVDKYLGVTSEPGLLQYLAGGHLGPHCYMRRLENLYFMTAGGVAPNPIEILSMKKMKQLIESLKRDFDTIILDAPPYSPIADARIVTGLSDGLIMVVRRGKTSYSSSDRAFKAVDPKKLLGVVFNDVKPMPFDTYHNLSYYGVGADRRLYSGTDKARTSPRNYLNP